MHITTSVKRLTTLDYLDGLGIAVGTHDISFVHTTKRFLQVALKKVRTVPLPDTSEDRPAFMRRAVADFLKDLGTVPDQTVLCLPRKEASVSRLVVPETARGSLEQVIRYEVERLLPFREDDIYYDYLTTEEGGEKRRLGVVIFCLPRQTVDPLVELLAEQNLRPQGVTLSSAAQTTTLLACCPAERRQQILAAREDGSLELNFLNAQQLVASQTVPLARVADADALTDVLAHSVARNFPGSAPDAIPVFTWDEQGALPLSVESDRDLAHMAQEQFPLLEEGGSLSVATCAAIGAALQAVGEGVEVNVLPAEDRARREKLLSPLTLAFVGCLLVLSLVWATGIVIQEHRILNQVQDQIQALAPTVRRVQGNEEEAQRLRAQLQTLRSETRLRLTPLLEDITERIPRQVYLTAFRFKAGDVELTGVAKTGLASDLVGALEESPCLQNVAPKAPFKKTGAGETFRLGAWSTGEYMRLAAIRAAWQRLSPRERTLAGLALGALVVVGLRYGVVTPYLSYTTRLEEMIERDLQRIAKMQRQRDRAEEVQKRARILEGRFAAAYQQLIPGETPTLAAAQLQERVQTLAGQSGLTVVTTQVLKEKSLGALRKTAVQMTLHGNTSALADFLSRVEYGDWLLSVSRLEVKGTSRRRRRRKQSLPPLTMTLEVEGVMQEAQATRAE